MFHTWDKPTLATFLIMLSQPDRIFTKTKTKIYHWICTISPLFYTNLQSIYSREKIFELCSSHLHRVIIEWDETVNSMKNFDAQPVTLSGKEAGKIYVGMQSSSSSDRRIAVQNFISQTRFGSQSLSFITIS